MRNQTLIHHFLEHSAARYPDKIALIHEETRATYTQINTQANQLAYWLIGQGINVGDRVVILFENCLEYVVSYYGTLKAGAVAVPLSTGLKPDGIKLLLGELGPKVFIASSRFERMLKATGLADTNLQALIINSPKLGWSPTPFSVFSLEEILLNSDSHNPDVAIDELSLASIIYTSGSTGTPKGVMLSHLNIKSNVAAICESLSLTENDIQMAVLPFFYVMGKSLLNTHFAVGGTVVINNKFAFPAAVVNQIIEEQVTGFSGVPSTYAYLLHRSPLASVRENLGSLRYCSQAGGHMPIKLRKELRRVLPKYTEIYIMYGATEASSRLTCLAPGNFKEKIGSIGKPIAGVAISIMDKNMQAVSANQPGELIAAGPNIMQGYWHDEKATAEVLDGHGYHTGDLGYFDEDGFLYVTGRNDNILKVGGHRVNPQEIEEILLATDILVETAVIGVPDALLGHRLIALAVPKSEDCNAKNILSFCAGKLPKYKLPEKVVLTRGLPKSDSGKIDKIKCLKQVHL